MDHAATDALIAQFYSAASGRIPWEEPLLELCQMMDTFAIQLMAVDRGTGGLLFSHVVGKSTPLDHLAYIRTYNRIDPRLPILLSLPDTGWTHCHDHISDAVVATHPFYQEFLIPIGGRYVSGTKLIHDESLTILIGVHRGNGSHPLNEKEIAFLEALRFHLVQALENYRYLAAKHYALSMGFAILDGLHQPTLLIDATKSIHYANAAAKELLASKKYLCEYRGTLACMNVEDNNNLVTEVLELADTSEDLPQPKRRYLRMRGAAFNAPVGVCISPLRPKEVMGAFGSVALLMVVVHEANNHAKPDPFMLAEVFDLTPAEVQVAIAIFDGHSIEDIAQRRRVAMGTIREQLKSIFSKTQTNRQADLVRRLNALSPIT